MQYTASNSSHKRWGSIKAPDSIKLCTPRTCLFHHLVSSKHLYVLSIINPWSVCAARVTVIGSVCVSVSPCFNSLLDCLFVPKTIRSTERVMTISLMEPFFLNMLCCRDLSAASIVRIQTVGHFHLRMRIIFTTCWSRHFSHWRSYVTSGNHVSEQGLPIMSS